jgi:hypothetical protein
LTSLPVRIARFLRLRQPKLSRQGYPIIFGLKPAFARSRGSRFEAAFSGHVSIRYRASENTPRQGVPWTKAEPTTGARSRSDVWPRGRPLKLATCLLGKKRYRNVLFLTTSTIYALADRRLHAGLEATTLGTGPSHLPFSTLPPSSTLLSSPTPLPFPARRVFAAAVRYPLVSVPGCTQDQDIPIVGVQSLISRACP